MKLHFNMLWDANLLNIFKKCSKKLIARTESGGKFSFWVKGVVSDGGPASATMWSRWNGTPPLLIICQKSGISNN